jgi:hypothetical protein
MVASESSAALTSFSDVEDFGLKLRFALGRKKYWRKPTNLIVLL